MPANPSIKAVQLYEFGEPDVLRYESIPKPTPKQGEVLVRVQATAVNALDRKIRSGYMQGFMDFSLPLILGCDVAGIVEAVGSGVTGFAPGDEIYAMPRNSVGMYAEYVTLPVTEVAKKPQSITFVEAASVPTVALTAWQGLFDQGNLAPGQTVLIHGAAGGVGSMAVQLAKSKEAYVIATASSAKVDFVHALGADSVIDYKAAPFENKVKEVDLVLDVLGDETRQRSWQVIKLGGMLVSTVPPFPTDEEGASVGVHGKGIAVQPNTAQLNEISRLIDTGKIKPTVDVVLPLADAKQAHELMQSGKVRGKIVLQVP
jgi:NADPH:quinone reductase-like Zn-dependent oxidoreductase